MAKVRVFGILLARFLTFISIFGSRFSNKFMIDFYILQNRYKQSFLITLRIHMQIPKKFKSLKYGTIK